MSTGIETKPKPEWPNCEAPDTSNEYWESNSHRVFNGAVYSQKEVEPGRWQYVKNDELTKRHEESQIEWANEQKHRRELFWALRSRILSVEEMEEVDKYGSRINIYDGVCYREKDKNEELNAALLNQFRMREAQRSADAVIAANAARSSKE